MQRRKPWNGNPPETPDAARRFLLDVATDCIDRFGLSKASLSDVAQAAGVTRQTVYRYFADAEDLFRAAAVMSGGGLHERMRARAIERESLAERMVETLVLAVADIPKDSHMSALLKSGDHFTVASTLGLGFVQEEMVALAEGELSLDEAARDELAEILLRLLHSFLTDPGLNHSEEALRAFLHRWLVPMVEARLAAADDRPAR